MTAEDLDKLCMNFPGATRGVKWGSDLCYMVGEKMFCVTNLDGLKQVTIKTSPEDFGELTARTGIIPAPYVGRNGWIQVQQPVALSSKEWKAYVRKSYDMVFEKLPAKLRAKLG